MPNNSLPGILDYFANGGRWPDQNVPTGGILDHYMRNASGQGARVTACRAGVEAGTVASINNPGAVFDDRDAAATDALPRSIRFQSSRIPNICLGCIPTRSPERLATAIQWRLATTAEMI
jgi:hypothetical protein